jgi:hypothetical protein
MQSPVRTSVPHLAPAQDTGAIPARQFARLPLRKRLRMVLQDPTVLSAPQEQHTRDLLTAIPHPRFEEHV